MRRATSMDAPEWATVSVGRPCPSCGASTGCAVAAAIAAVRCRALRSERPLVGGGWFHVLPPSASTASSRC
jgi:hypothetical protein